MNKRLQATQISLEGVCIMFLSEECQICWCLAALSGVWGRAWWLRGGDFIFKMCDFKKRAL